MPLPRPIVSRAARTPRRSAGWLKRSCNNIPPLKSIPSFKPPWTIIEPTPRRMISSDKVIQNLAFPTKSIFSPRGINSNMATVPTLDAQGRHTSETKNRLEHGSAHKNSRKHTDSNTDCQGHGKAFDWPRAKLKEHQRRHDSGDIGIENRGESAIKSCLHRGAW